MQRLEMIQHLSFETATTKIMATPDGEYLNASASSPDLYWINLEQGRFLSPLSTRSPALNVVTRSKLHGLVVCGGEDGAVECFGMRSRSSVGRINAVAPPGYLDQPASASASASASSEIRPMPMNVAAAVDRSRKAGDMDGDGPYGADAVPPRPAARPAAAASAAAASPNGAGAHHVPPPPLSPLPAG
ncbi:hypothetical protein SAY87_011033 [Trapa incisa]|uniref:Nucleolar protein 10-like N-terminal domain-containing protein n=2 Tax=Trapa TaxID=22665 RepID=A0AAN7GIQ1_9MYRT|nr:hypothetical protein SAY87_011033 [Trapa incisa]